MRSDPQLPLLVALTIGVGWTMYFSGLKKRMLELKHRQRICPSCGRSITGRVCSAH